MEGGGLGGWVRGGGSLWQKGGTQGSSLHPPRPSPGSLAAQELAGPRHSEPLFTWAQGSPRGLGSSPQKVEVGKGADWDQPACEPRPPVQGHAGSV